MVSSLKKPLTVSDPGLGRGGDMVCRDGDDGAACLLWNLPDGYGQPIPDPLHALALLNVLYKTLLASGPKLTKKYGEWAVVTGATDGVGKAMSFELARKGCRRALRPPRAAVL